MEQYQIVSDRIQKDYNSYMAQLLSVLNEEIKEPDDNGGDRHKLALTVLQSYRISLACRLEDRGITEGLEDISMELEKVLANIKSLEYKFEIDNMVVSDAMGYICTVSGSDH